MVSNETVYALSQLQLGMTVPVCCVVLDINYPTEQAHGFLLKVRGVDDTILAYDGDHNVDYFDIAIWKKAVPHFPQISSVGDVLFLEACNVREWGGKTTLSVSKATRTHVYSFDEEKKRYRKLRDFSMTRVGCFSDEPIPARVQQLANWAQGLLSRDLLYSGSSAYNKTVTDLSSAIRRSFTHNSCDIVCQIRDIRVRQEESKVELVLGDNTSEEIVPLCINTRSCEYAAMIGFVKNAVVKLRKLSLNSTLVETPPDTVVFTKESSLVYYPSFSLQWKQTSAAYSAGQAIQNNVAQAADPNPAAPAASPRSYWSERPVGQSNFNLAANQREAVAQSQNQVSSAQGFLEPERVCSFIESAQRVLPRTSLADVVKIGCQSLGSIFQVHCQVALIYPSDLTELCRPLEGGYEYYFAMKLCDSTEAIECYVFGNETREIFKGLPAQDFAHSPAAKHALAQYVDKLTSDDWRPICIKPFMHDGKVHFQLVKTEFRFERTPTEAGATRALMF